ncbi:MAG: class I SAM-dependent methyltransferase [Candidatus Heimdallarchaeota archaeon]|nr:class I SAM-dependent methyltransferase [Candidatus Heimdallarchaeota archaeon]
MSWKRTNPEGRLQPLLSILDKSESSELWIDIGSGDGLFSRILENIFPQITVIQCDITDYANYGQLGIRSFIQQLGIRPKSVNGILCSQVIHYLDYSQQEKVLNELNRYLVQDGVLLIIEYTLKRSYSWIPFPLSQVDVMRYAESSNIWEFIASKSISDGNRPKHSSLLRKR